MLFFSMFTLHSSLMSLAIETRHLSYSFRYKRKVVDDLSLQVPQGSIYGFLGPNGAGKTTTMRLLTSLLKTEEDNIFLYGKSLLKNIPYIFQNVSALIETPSLYLHLSAIENLRVVATLRGIENASISRILETVGLEKHAKRRVKEYSLGMKQRLALGIALLPDPDMLMLDEPANGLDPHGIIEMRELLIRLNKEQGKTIFVSSHILSEVEKTCTHIGIIHKGSLRFQGSMDELRKTAESKKAVFTIDQPQQWKDIINDRLDRPVVFDHDHFVTDITSRQEVSAVNAQLVSLGVPVVNITAGGGLEEWFLNMTKK
jgi:lantibiotic transport system ATP-binding protein